MSEKLQMKFRYRVAARVLNGRDPRAVGDEAVRHYMATGRQTDGVEITAYHRNPRKNKPNPDWRISDTPKSLKAFFTTLAGAIRTMVESGALSGVAGPGAAGPVVVSRRSEGARQGAVTRKRERSVKAKQAPRVKRAKAARAYQSELRKLKAEHPKWDHKRAQSEYRRQSGGKKGR